ncbi:hypothetical protein GCM10028803_11980 [Larkinella knui]
MSACKTNLDTVEDLDENVFSYEKDVLINIEENRTSDNYDVCTLIIRQLDAKNTTPTQRTK